MSKIIGVHSAGSPVGTIKPFAGSSAPAGTLICDGSAISRTTYAQLFAIIGTTYGTGDGSTTFNLPLGTGVTLRGAGTQLRQTFTITAGNASAGAVYSNNSQTFTVLNTISAGTTLICSSTGAPLSSGTLTKVSGTGDATLTFSAVASNTYAATLGQHQNDQMQGHVHSQQYSVIGGSGNDGGKRSNAGSEINTGVAVSDGTNGTPRVGTETRMANLGTNFVIVFR